MKRPILFLSSLILLLVLSIGVFWLSGKSTAEAHNVNPQSTVSSFEVFNQKAMLARTGDSVATQEYVNEITSISGFENEMRGVLGNNFKTRVSLAEVRYRQGQSAGIPEVKVARTVNGLARLFRLPNYARTNLYEVRKLRLSLLVQFPQVFNQDQQLPVAGMHIADEMSPAEATFVLAMLLQQKLINEDYQVTHAERLNRWNHRNELRTGQSQSWGFGQARKREIASALRSGFLSSPYTVLQLSNLTLNTLGVE